MAMFPNRQVLELPNWGSSVPQIPGANTLFERLARGWETGRESPYAIYRGEQARGKVMMGDKDCCPCPPGQQSMPHGPGQQSAPPGLGQPMTPQKPFQDQMMGGGQDPCSYNDSVLRGLGIDPDMLCACCKGGKTHGASVRQKAAARRTNKSLARTRGGTVVPRRKKAAARRTNKSLARTRGVEVRYVWSPRKSGKGGICRDQVKNKAVAWSNCGK